MDDRLGHGVNRILPLGEYRTVDVKNVHAYGKLISLPLLRDVYSFDQRLVY